MVLFVLDIGSCHRFSAHDDAIAMHLRLNSPFSLTSSMKRATSRRQHTCLSLSGNRSPSWNFKGFPANIIVILIILKLLLIIILMMIIIIIKYLDIILIIIIVKCLNSM